MNYRTLGDCLKEKQNNFNIIRLIAALAVIYGHADAVTGRGPADIFLQFVGFKFIGGVAVDVFFVVSGFLVTASALSGNGVLYYLKSRLLRIYPALFVCIGLTVLVLGPALTVSTEYWRAPETWRFLWVNATAYGTEYFLPGVFQGMHDKAVNGSLWSLAVEVKMYWIVLALYLLGVLKSRSVFNGLFFCSLVVGYFAPDVWTPLFQHSNHLYVGMVFAIGAFFYINRDYIFLSPMWMLSLLFFAAATHNTKAFVVAYTLLLAYGVFYLAFGRNVVWFQRVGDYSYGVYLYGWLAQQLVLMWMPEMSNQLNTLLGGALALACAIASWHLIEKPALSLKKRFSFSKPAAQP